MTWLVAGTAVALIAWLWFRATRPHLNELTDPGALPRMLTLLLSRGVHKADVRGSLTVCVRSAPDRRLIFTKYIRDSGVTGIEASLPAEAWSAPLYDAFRASLDRCGIRYDTDDRSREGFHFDLARDYGGAYMVARLVFEDTMRLRISRDCVAYYRDVVLSNQPGLTGVDADERAGGRRTARRAGKRSVR